jgi:hypothetical protein
MSARANLLVDAICVNGIGRVAGALRRAYHVRLMASQFCSVVATAFMGPVQWSITAGLMKV